jgi:hypothetical protein
LFPINHNNVHQGVIDLENIHGGIRAQRGDADWAELLSCSLGPFPLSHHKPQIKGLYSSGCATQK